MRPRRAWHLLREAAAGTALLFECYEETLAGDTTFLATSVGCEGKTNHGPVGYIYTSQVANSYPLYRCRDNLGLDHFVSESPQCDGATVVGLLGYARRAP